MMDILLDFFVYDFFAYAVVFLVTVLATTFVCCVAISIGLWIGRILTEWW